MKRYLMAAIATGALLIAPSLALAATSGFATANVNMRSGPSTGYPAVVVVPVGAPITIHGCMSNVNWCDISFAGGRGWVSGSYIQTSYRQNRVYVQPDYYQSLGIPSVTFEVDNYWGRHYRNRDFYRDRDRWDRRPPPPPPRWTRDDRRGPPPRDWDRNDDRRGPPPRDWDRNDDRRGPPPGFDRDGGRDRDRGDFNRGNDERLRAPPAPDRGNDDRRGPPPGFDRDGGRDRDRGNLNPSNDERLRAPSGSDRGNDDRRGPPNLLLPPPG